MIWFSYHGGHSGSFCAHATSTLREVIETAIARGFSHYGVSEHCPRYEMQHLYPGEETLGLTGLAAAFEAYVTEALALRDEFADRIEILIGFETEKLPAESWLHRMQALRAAHPFDYVVGSVHDIAGTWIDYTAEATARLEADIGGQEVLHVAYFREVADMVERLRPQVVAHLDLIRKFSPAGFAFTPTAMREVTRALTAIRDHGGVIDVNCAAFRNGFGPVYPLPQILDLACKMEIPVTLGDDSHGAATVGVGLEQSLGAIRAAGYRSLSYLTRNAGWCMADLADVVPGGGARG